jgi:AmiR/NasT family two-component response regulator
LPVGIHPELRAFQGAIIFAVTSDLEECHDDLTEAQAEAKHLRIALETRAPIEQAKGILMTLIESCTDDEAFDLLVKVSQRTGVKLHDVAVKLCESVGKENKLPPEFVAACQPQS